jgi:hypothetical protein
MLPTSLCPKSVSAAGFDAAKRRYEESRESFPGLPDFSWSKHTNFGKNTPNDHKLYQTAMNYTK